MTKRTIANIAVHEEAPDGHEIVNVRRPAGDSVSTFEAGNRITLSIEANGRVVRYKVILLNLRPRR